jgi:hypothetical protein
MPAKTREAGIQESRAKACAAIWTLAFARVTGCVRQPKSKAPQGGERTVP